MIINLINACKAFIYIVLFSWSVIASADNFSYNTYNNHGVVGLIALGIATFVKEVMILHALPRDFLLRIGTQPGGSGNTL